jgi:putative nucleotidyltransferase with HDIG domain
MASAPVHQFLSKPCDPKVLKAVLARAFSAQEFAANEHFRKLLSGLPSLPALPDVYLEVQAELASQDPSLERVGDIIGRDMAMTAKLLQLVSSAFFGLSRPITCPVEAAVFVGTETLKALVLSIQVFSQFEGLKQFKVNALWRHCWTTAVLARQICDFEEVDPQRAGYAFVAGLLHDLGKLVIAANDPDKYRSAWELAHRRGISFWEAELELYQTSHAELGGYLLARWGLPEPVVEAVAFHHRPGLSRDRAFTPLTAVHAANVFSKEHVCDSDAVSQPVEVDYLQGIGLGDRVEQWQDLAIESILQVA